MKYKCISTCTFIIKGSSDAGDTSGTVTISSTTSRFSKRKRFPVKVLTQWKEGIEVHIQTHTEMYAHTFTYKDMHVCITCLYMYKML